MDTVWVFIFFVRRLDKNIVNSGGGNFRPSFENIHIFPKKGRGPEIPSADVLGVYGGEGDTNFLAEL